MLRLSDSTLIRRRSAQCAPISRRQRPTSYTWGSDFPSRNASSRVWPPFSRPPGSSVVARRSHSRQMCCRERRSGCSLPVWNGRSGSSVSHDAFTGDICSTICRSQSDCWPYPQGPGLVRRARVPVWGKPIRNAIRSEQNFSPERWIAALSPIHRPGISCLGPRLITCQPSPSQHRHPFPAALCQRVRRALRQMGMGNPCPGCTVAPTVWPTRLGPLKTCNRTTAMTEGKDRTRFAQARKPPAVGC